MPSIIKNEHLVRGMLASASAVFCFSVMNVCAKYLSRDLSVIEIGFYRNLIALLPFLVMAFIFGQREILVIKTKPHFIILRAVLGVVSLLATFGAYSMMPMAETSVILFTSSFFMPVLGLMVLHEHVNRFRWTAVIIGFVGVALVANPSGDLHVLGIALAILAALLQAIMAITLRFLGGHEKPETISFYFFITGIVLTAPALPFIAHGPAMEHIPAIIGVGLSGALAQWCYSVALKHTPAALVAVFNYTSLLWALLFGWLIWNDWPSYLVLIGAAVIITANLLILIRETRTHKMP